LEFDGDTVVRIRKGTLDRVPDATKITNACDLNALSLLGVADSATTWQTIRSRFQSKQVNPDVGWMEEADQAILSAIRGENIPTIDLAVRALSDSSGAEIYSCVLSRQKEFRSGRQKLFLLFVRTRNRRLANDEQMAALLALQIMTTRFRFEVLKGPWSFQPNTSTKAVDQQAQQFLRLINKAECEAAEYGMSNAILNSAFDAKNRNALKVLSAQWHKDKEKLERTITAGKSSGEKVARINSFIMAWLPKNHDFLTMVSKQFLDRLQSDRASNI
jgi:hypothetical protein